MNHFYVGFLVCLRYGLRNSLLLAPMPTASTAQILGNNESFEPYTSNIYSRRVLSGEFQVFILCLNCAERFTYNRQNAIDRHAVNDPCYICGRGNLITDTLFCPKKYHKKYPN